MMFDLIAWDFAVRIMRSVTRRQGVSPCLFGRSVRILKENSRKIVCFMV